ncbi:hypothetical protein COY28_03775 [Candidatus Woesearchaeota archaeon CG_4_10_14_0_2_um_filter_57_5]|nr:MAG: hypothetical protein COY28_03775 [Candidatus Woesearchaeota archaeon CG_4_10_14_0_2_um_filter_57_5]
MLHDLAEQDPRTPHEAMEQDIERIKTRKVRTIILDENNFSVHPLFFPDQKGMKTSQKPNI